jgi:hypothetical protein
MNNIIRIIALICVAVSLCGCGGYYDETIPVETTTFEETEAVTIETEVTEATEATEAIETVPDETEVIAVTEVVEEVRWDIPGEEYVIDITRDAETDFEKMAWAIYLEGGGDAVCDDCRRRIADVILNRVECRITNFEDDYYWPDTITDVLSDGQINPYQNMGNRFAWPETAHCEGEHHAVERAYRIAHEVLRGNHSEIYRKGYLYYAGANAYGWEPETAIYHCGIYFMRQRGWDNSKFEQDWTLSFD